MANIEAKVADPTEWFSLHDICLWESSLVRESDYQPALHDGKTKIQSKRSIRPEGYTVEFEGEEDAADVMRVFVTLGVRNVFSEEADEGKSADLVLYTLSATFMLEFFIIAAPDEQHFETFINKNCTHIAWPFWRQHVYDTLKRASLPVPVIPLLSSRSKPKKKVKRVSPMQIAQGVQTTQRAER